MLVVSTVAKFVSPKLFARGPLKQDPMSRYVERRFPLLQARNTCAALETDYLTAMKDEGWKAKKAGAGVPEVTEAQA